MKDKLFTNKEQAKLYLNELKNRKIIVIRTEPDLTEGRYGFSKEETFVVLRDIEKELKSGQNIETLKKL